MTGEFSRRRVLLIMTALLLLTVMASLDASFMPLAFADMIDDLDSSTSEIVWVALGYLIAATGPMLLAARFADAFGHARLFQIGTVVYSLAMIACTWAPDVGTLIALRLIQGCGMACFLPTTFAIATRIYGPEQRGRALGLLQAANATGFILGPVFAGWLLDAYDWRAIFASRIPVAVIGIALALVSLAGVRLRVAGATRRFDLPGALFLTLAMFGVLYGCTRLPVEDNHLNPIAWLIFSSGFLFLFLFIRQERRAPEPLIDLDLFTKSREFTRASIAFAAMFASFPLTLFVLPIVLINGLEMRAWDVGMVMAISAVCTTLISPFAGRAADRIAPEILSSIGTILRGIGYLLLLFVVAGDGKGALVVPLIVIGLGTGLFFSPNNALLLANAPPERAGMVSGLFGTLRQAGYAIGFALIASLFAVIQTTFERDWVFTAIHQLPDGVADQLAMIFEGGSIWSPDMLVFILRVSAVVCTAIMGISLVNSLPRLRMNWRRQLVTGVVCATAGIGGVYALTMLVPGGFSISEPAYAAMDESWPVAGVEAFGMSSRVAPPELAQSDAVVFTGSPDLFAMHCATCHGKAGLGVDGLGVSLVDSSFVANAASEDLVVFLRQGRMTADPASVSGRPMPGFAWLPETSLRELAARLQELHQSN
jgi:EmrB/QacA subfamily drug resistance transporter